MRRYPENDEWNRRPQQRDDIIIAEAQLVYVAPPQRGQSLGSVLLTTAALEAIADPRVHILRMQAADEKIDAILQRLGFLPSGKGNFGYNDYRIDLRKDRKDIRDIFEKHLAGFTVPEPGSTA